MKALDVVYILNIVAKLFYYQFPLARHHCPALCRPTQRQGNSSYLILGISNSAVVKQDLGIQRRFWPAKLLFERNKICLIEFGRIAKAGRIGLRFVNSLGPKIRVESERWKFFRFDGQRKALGTSISLMQSIKLYYRAVSISVRVQGGFIAQASDKTIHN